MHAGRSLPFEHSYTLTEVNGRTDYCIEGSGADCNDFASVEAASLSPTDPSHAIKFKGPELFHFAVTVQSDSYCDLDTEFHVWVFQPPAQLIVTWTIISVTAFSFGFALFVAYLVHLRRSGKRF
jgi:hypothetical protein